MHLEFDRPTLFYLDHELKTGQEIRNDPDLLDRVDFDGDGKVNERDIGEPYIDPHNQNVEVTFSPTTEFPEVYHASFIDLPPGRYGRIIMLTDMPYCYFRIKRESMDPIKKSDTFVLLPGVINQEDSQGVFDNTQVATYRGVLQHNWFAYGWHYPDSIGWNTAPWPEPENKEPIPATAINP